MKRLLSVAVCLAALAATLPLVAGADPSNATSSGVLNTLCSGETVTVVTNGNGIFSPAHDVASTSNFVPTAFNVTLTFAPAGGGSPSVDHAIVGKTAPIQNTVECTIPLQTLDAGPAGVQTIQGFMTGFWTPR